MLSSIYWESYIHIQTHKQFFIARDIILKLEKSLSSATIDADFFRGFLLYSKKMINFV